MCEGFMRQAIELAARARGRTSPNPMVGAVLVRDGQILAEGYHQRAGEPHAEVVALRKAGPLAQGAILYTNLEPCCHWGRTPPCTRAIIDAGVAQVHMAMLDPNPLVNGKGKAELEASGIAIHVGLCEKEARRLNEAFIKYITTGRPFVTAKFAMSLDGKIATHSGESRWITGGAARERAHMLRDVSDTIMVGMNTVLADDPLLTARLDRPDVHHPLRVVVDTRGRIPLEARMLASGQPAHTLVASTELMSKEKHRQLEERGAEVLILPHKKGHVDLAALMDVLGDMEVVSLLVEGGGAILGSLFSEGLVDKVMAFIAPKIIGGAGAPTPVEGEGVASLAEALQLEDVEVERLGADILVSGYIHR